MNLRQMEIFRLVLTTGSATAAAARLNITQPAVSRALSQFEDDLGLQLFVRDKGRLMPTPEAVRLHDQVDTAMTNIQHVRDMATGLRQSVTGELRIILPHSLSQGILPGVLREFLARRPAIRTSVSMASYSEIEKAVAQRDADIGFSKLPISGVDVEIEPLPTVESVCVVPAGHRLARESVIDIESLADEPLILLGLSRPSRYEIDKIFQARRVSQNVAIETHSVGTACSLVSEGLGIAIVNEMMARQFASPAARIVLFRPPVKHRFALIYPPNLPRTRLAKAFGRIFRRRLASLTVKRRKQ